MSTVTRTMRRQDQKRAANDRIVLVAVAQWQLSAYSPGGCCFEAKLAEFLIAL